MKFDVVFPKNVGQRYFNTHFQYVLNIFKDLDSKIKEEERDGFVVTINGQSFLFDYADTDIPVVCNIPVFKFHCKYESERVSSFPPVSFLNWADYRDFRNLCQYKAKGSINMRQRFYGNATERRNTARNILINKFPGLNIAQVSQKEFWLEINNCFLPVFVPGWCNNMLDRGQFQYMALGCCTISPRLPECLPFGKKLIPNEHYIQCKDDYSDLIDLIKFYECFRETCIEIGNNAKQLFEITSTPEAIGNWIGDRLWRL